MNNIDSTIIVILAFLGILGLRRGLLSEIYFFLTTFLSISLASRFAIILSTALTGSETLSHSRLIFLVFLLSYALTILPVWAGELILYEKLSSKICIPGIVSKIGGAILGIIKGVPIVSALIIVLLKFETGTISQNLWRSESLKLLPGVIKKLLVLFPEDFSTILLDMKMRGMM